MKFDLFFVKTKRAYNTFKVNEISFKSKENCLVSSKNEDFKLNFPSNRWVQSQSLRKSVNEVHPH